MVLFKKGAATRWSSSLTLEDELTGWRTFSRGPFLYGSGNTWSHKRAADVSLSRTLETIIVIHGEQHPLRSNTHNLNILA